jgi:hypothetical protein
MATTTHPHRDVPLPARLLPTDQDGASLRQVEIIKCVTSRIGTRYLVQGLESGRQWFINHSTLLGSYEPRRLSPPL